MTPRQELLNFWARQEAKQAGGLPPNTTGYGSEAEFLDNLHNILADCGEYVPPEWLEGYRLGWRQSASHNWRMGWIEGAATASVAWIIIITMIAKVMGWL